MNQEVLLSQGIWQQNNPYEPRIDCYLSKYNFNPRVSSHFAGTDDSYLGLILQPRW